MECFILKKKSIYIKIALHFRQSDQWILIVRKTVKEHTSTVCGNLYCIFLTWGPFLSKSGTFVHYYFFPFCHSLSWRVLCTEKKWCIKAFLLHQFEGLKASWFLRIMIYAQVGCRGDKDLCDPSHGILGIILGAFPSIVLIMLPLYSCQHLLLIVYYSTSTLPCCLFLNQWASHSKALWGFFCSLW